MLDQILSDLKKAQLERDIVRVSTLRLLIAELNNAKIDKGHELSDDEILAVTAREVKKRKEAAAGFRSGDREDSAKEEEAEAEILNVYLPTQLSDEELTNIVEDTISEASQLKLVKEAPSLQDMGTIIKLVMEKVAGKADGGRVSGFVKEKLSS